MNAKEMIRKYLDERAKKDELFAKAYENPEKSLDECWSYIQGEIKKRVRVRSGVAVECVSDDEVYGLAVHYYDEKDIKVEGVRGDVKVEAARGDVKDEDEANGSGVNIAELKAQIRAEMAEEAEKKRLEEKAKKPKKKYTKKKIEEKREAIEKLQLDLFA